MKKFLSIVLLSALFLNISLSLACAWSSLDHPSAKGLATHEFLNDKAYDELEKHPVFKEIKFPDRKKIFEYSRIDSSKQGKGPDNPANSKYDEHYYNPRTGAGSAPKSVQTNFNGLKHSLQDLAKYDNKARAEDLMERAAKYAAYSAHFIQDMNCSFHVSGQPRSEINANIVPGPDITGSYRQSYTPEQWRLLVERAKEDTDSNTNWFDPLYYDGPNMQPVMGSTHFVYEGLIEGKYIFTPLDWISININNRFISPFWKKDKSAEQLAKDLALETRNVLDRKDPDVYFSADDFQQRMRTLETTLQQNPDTLVGSIRKRVNVSLDTYSVITTDMQAPFKAWSRAIQATYTLWRGSFSALLVKPEDIVLVKAKGKEDEYYIKVRVQNLEPEDLAQNVKVRIEAKAPGFLSGNFAGTIKDTISKSQTSEWKKLEGTVRVKGLKEEQGQLRFSDKSGAFLRVVVEGSYNNVPDSGIAVCDIPLSEIKVEAIKLQEVLKSDRVGAINILKGQSNKFEITEEKGERAPDKIKEFTVQKQEPKEGSWVAEDEKITLTLFDFGPVIISGTVQCESISEKSDQFWGASMKTKPVSGAQVTAMVDGIRRDFVTQEDGKFKLSFDDKYISQENKKAKVTAQCKNYSSYEGELPFAHEAQWTIMLKSQEKAVLTGAIANVTKDLSKTSITFCNWEYDIVIKAENVGVILNRMEILGEGKIVKEDLHEKIFINAGSEGSIHQRTASYGTQDRSMVHRRTVIFGEDFNGNSVRVDVDFNQKQDSTGEADDDPGFGETTGWEPVHTVRPVTPEPDVPSYGTLQTTPDPVITQVPQLPISPPVRQNPQPQQTPPDIGGIIGQLEPILRNFPYKPKDKSPNTRTGGGLSVNPPASGNTPINFPNIPSPTSNIPTYKPPRSNSATPTQTTRPPQPVSGGTTQTSGYNGNSIYLLGNEADFVPKPDVPQN